MRYRPLRRNAEFGRVYGRGKAYVHPQLVLYVLKTRSGRTRVGLTATKKIGGAVQRNRARRVMRAAIAEHLDPHSGGYDLVFVARGQTPHLKSTVLSRTVARLLAQAGLPDRAAARPAMPLSASHTDAAGDGSRPDAAAKPAAPLSASHGDSAARENAAANGTVGGQSPVCGHAR